MVWYELMICTGRENCETERETRNEAAGRNEAPWWRKDEEEASSGGDDEELADAEVRDCCCTWREGNGG